MLTNLFKTFKTNQIIHPCFIHSFLNFVIAKEITLSNGFEESDIYNKNNNRMIWELLDSDLASLKNMKGDYHKEIYESIVNGYSNPCNKESFVEFYKKNINSNENLKAIKDIRDMFISEEVTSYKKIKLNSSIDQAKDTESQIKIPIPRDLLEKVEGNSPLEEIVYYILKYAITGKCEVEETGFYISNRDEYFSALLNNLVAGNINKKGIVESLVEQKNTFAMFEKATNLLFKNATKSKDDRTLNRKKALRIYEEIISIDPNMPWANWGIGYIYLNYPHVYGAFNSDKERFKEAYKYARKAADYRCGAAYTLLGRIYDESDGKYFPKSINKSAKDYYEESRDLGYLYALNNIGKCELKLADASDKKSKEEPTRRAFDCFKELADANNEPYACNEVGRFLSGQYPYFKSKLNLEKALNYWRTAIEYDEDKYYSFWPRYNIIYFSLKGVAEGSLKEYKRKEIQTYYSFLNKYRELYEYDEKNAQDLREDYVNHECYVDFLDKITDIIQKDSLSEEDKKIILKLVKPKN